MEEDKKTKKKLIEELKKSKQKIIALESTLQPSESRMKVVIENMRDVIGINDLNGIFQFVTPSVKEVLGYEVGDLIGRNSLDFIHPEDLERAEQALNNIVKKGQAEESYRFRHADGHYVFLESSGQAIKTRNKVTGFVISSRDITKRMRAEEALKESESRFRNLAELLPEAVYETDSQLNFTFGNRKAFDLFGYSPEDLKAGLNALSVIAPEDRHKVMESFSRRLQGEELGLLEYTGVRKDGSLFPVLLHNVPIQKEGKFIGARGIVIDITERKQMEEALRESEATSRALINAPTDSVLLVDAQGLILELNEIAARRLGKSREDLIGTLADQVIPEDIARKRRSLISQVFATGRAVRFEDERDGSWYDTVAYPIADTDGRIGRIAVIARDISDRKRAEAEEMKRHKLESVGTLAAGIAHDFNNLLAVIHGYLELLAMDIPSGDKVHNRLMAVNNAVIQATELTNRLIIFAKGGEPVKEVIDIGDTVKNEVLGSIGISPVEKRFYLDPDLWPVEVDQKQIQQVIKNLTRNAVEAMPEGGRLTVRAENMTVRIQDRLPIREGAYVRISVEDTGTGIPANELPNIFDPYYSTKRRGAKKGMGLGLSVCHSVVSKHNGCITTESQEGKGCTFRVYLPAIVRGALRIDERHPDKVPGSKRRILVMDDEALVRDMLRELLTALGFEVETTKDGLEAIDLYIKAAESERPYEMVLLDLMVIGGLGGEQTMARLLATHPGVKGIICSGYTDDPVIQNYAQYGFVGELRKPFTLKALQSILEKHL